MFEPGQVLRLRYEVFVDDPLSGLHRICDHCGLEMTTELARQVQEMVKTDRKLKWQRFDPGELARIMPELKEVSPWHSVGQRRSLDELGRIAEQPISGRSFGGDFDE